MPPPTMSGTSGRTHASSSVGGAPPTYPATFTRHDFVVGGESRYFMTGPAGENPKGWWRIDSIDRPRRLEFANGLAGEDGEPLLDVEPMSGFMTLEVVDSGTRMTCV